MELLWTLCDMLLLLPFKLSSISCCIPPLYLLNYYVNLNLHYDKECNHNAIRPGIMHTDEAACPEIFKHERFVLS